MITSIVCDASDWKTCKAYIVQGLQQAKSKTERKLQKIYVDRQLEYTAKKTKCTNREKLNTHHRENKQKLQCYH